MSSIANTLGVGSGIDTDSLIASLVSAAKTPQETVITNRQTANKAQVSALADLASGIDSFTSALSTLISGGTLFTQPNSSNTDAVDATAIAGARISGLSSSLSVQQLAQGQTLVSTAQAGTTSASAVGTGTLTLTTPSGSVDIKIDSTNNSYAGLAKAINDANAGVSASVLTDSSGARLVIKGKVGATQSFSLSASADADASLAAFTYPADSGGMTRTQAAQDAIVSLDGVSVTRSSNTITDLVQGVSLNLKAVTTYPVSLTSTQPIANMRQAVLDFADTYNALTTKLTADVAPASGTTAAGALIGDDGVRTMQTMLSKLTSTVLSQGGKYSTLAEIGVSTGQDGQLSVDTDQLDAALANDPDSIEAMFNPTQYSSSAAVTITSAMGKTKPGTYTLTDVTVGPPPSGKINGVAATVIGNKLVATSASGALGLVLQPTADAASVTVTVEAGLGGALSTIDSTLRDTTNGALTISSNRLTQEATDISDDETALETRMSTYQDQLTTQFTAMDTKVAALKATQSYLTQQIALWTKSDS